MLLGGHIYVSTVAVVGGSTPVKYKGLIIDTLANNVAVGNEHPCQCIRVGTRNR